jgi:hypothetical protein
MTFCMMGPEHEAPEVVDELKLVRELAYRLPFSQAQRRIAIYKRAA